MAAILKGCKFYACMLQASTRGFLSSSSSPSSWWKHGDQALNVASPTSGSSALLRHQNVFGALPAFHFDLSRQLVSAVSARPATEAEVTTPEDVGGSRDRSGKGSSADVERALWRLDQDIRRTGRVTRRDVENVLAEVRRVGTATSTQALLLIRCCGALVADDPPPVRTRLAQDVWAALDETLGVKMDVSHFNALLRVFLENEHKFAPLEFLAYMQKERGVEPNRVTYQRLVMRFCQEGDIAGASKILEFMKAEGLPINEAVFHALMLGHVRAGDRASARATLDLMRQAQVQPTAASYAALLKALAEQPQHAVDDIREVYEECDKLELEMSDREHLDVLVTLASAPCSKDDGSERSVQELMDSILSVSGGRLRRVSGFNQDALNACMRLINAGREDVARKVMALMLRPSSSSSLGDGEETGGDVVVDEDDGDNFQSGAFFIRQMVKADRPIEKTLAYVDEFERDRVHTKASLVALQAALSLGRSPVALAVMQRMADDQRYPLRPHYFWPLFARAGGAASGPEVVKEVVGVLRQMTSWGVSINLETVTDYVLPRLMHSGSSSSPMDVVNELQAAGVGLAVAANACVRHLLLRGDISAAAALARSGRVPSLSWRYLHGELRDAFVKTGAVKPTLQLLSHLTFGSKDGGGGGATTLTSEEAAALLPARFCFLVLQHERVQSDVGRIEALLEGMANAGFGLSVSASEQLAAELGAGRVTESISSSLEKLTANPESAGGPRTMAASRRRSLPDNRTFVLSTLEKRLETVGSEDTEERAKILRQVLSLHVRERNVEKTEETLKRMEAEQLSVPIGFLALLVDMYSQTGDAHKALGLFREFSQRDPSALMDTAKVFRLANALAKEDRFQEALDVVKSAASGGGGGMKQQQEMDANGGAGAGGGGGGVNAVCCWRFLNTLAEKQRADELREAVDILRESSLVRLTNVLLGPLVKVHLLQGQKEEEDSSSSNHLEKALAAFKFAAQEFRCTPWKTELTMALIEREDADGLQQVVDLSTKVHGELNSLYDLVFCFLDSGRTRQAKKILETPGLRARNYKLKTVCERYVDEGRVDDLDKLVGLTKDIFDTDRQMLYTYLLKAMCKRGDAADKVLGLWTTMQEEEGGTSVQPSDEFLTILANYLKERGEPVPFAVPQKVARKNGEEEEEMTTRRERRRKDQRQGGGEGEERRKNVTSVATPFAAAASPSSSSSSSSEVAALRRSLRNGDVDSALKLKTEIELKDGGQKRVPVTDVSHLISLLLNGERVDEAVGLATEMRARGQHPLPSTLKYLLARLAALGDHDSIMALGDHLPLDLKKRVSYDNRLCSALIHAGQGQRVLDGWRGIQDAQVLKETFPMGGALALLHSSSSEGGNNPEQLVADYEAFAKHVGEKHKFLRPLNMLWMWLLTSGRLDESRAVFERHLRDADELMFRSLLRVVRTDHNVDLAQELMARVKDTRVSPKSKGIVLSALLDTQVHCGRVDEAMEKLKTSLDDSLCQLTDLGHATLERLKASAELSGRQFPYTIPPKQQQQRGGGSDEDKHLEEGEMM